MHDAISAERLGVPALGVMTANFVSAAELMARVLAMPGYRFCVIDHPISSSSAGDLYRQAQTALSAVGELILG